MIRQERIVATVILALIAGGALAIHFGKPRLGKPGLVVEEGSLTNEVGKVVREERVHFPERVPGFVSRDMAISDIEVKALPADTTFGRKLYWDESGFGAQASAVLMKMDRTSIHRPQVCITGQGWTIQKTETIEIPVPLPSPYTLKATCLTSTKMFRNPKTNEERKIASVYVYWFVAEHDLAPGHSEALWNISRDLVTTGVLHPWGYVSFYTQCAPGQEGAYTARLKRLIAATTPEFQLTPPRALKQTAFHGESASLN
jgi:hypothetical protein